MLNPFLPSHQSNGHRNFFELDIKEYASPCWWTLAFSWISFLPLMPSMCSPIFEKLHMPIMSSMKNLANTLCFQTYQKNGCKWTKIFLMLSNLFVAATNSLCISHQSILLRLYQRPHMVWSTAHGSM